MDKRILEDCIKKLYDKVLDDGSRYFYFHKIMQGYDFRRRSDGCIKGKVGLWTLFKDQPEILEQLITNTHPEYTKIDKQDYKDGEYCGVLESENKWKAYKLCPEKQVRKKREEQKNN